MKASKSQLARIHIAKKDLGLDEVVYRQILVNETGKQSAAEFTYWQAKKVLEYFEAAGWKPKLQDRGLRTEERERQRSGFAAPRQKRMIQGLWADLSYAPKEKQAGALREFMHKKFGVSDLQFLSAKGAPKVIAALQAMQRQIKRSSEFGVRRRKEERHEGDYFMATLGDVCLPEMENN